MQIRVVMLSNDDILLSLINYEENKYTHATNYALKKGMINC